MADRGVVLVNAAGEREFFYDEQVDAALAAGWVPPGDQVVESNLTGGRAVLSSDQYAAAQSQAPGGLSGPDLEAELALQAQREGEARYGGIGQGLLAAGEGAAGALTLGLSDLALDAAGAETAGRAEFSSGRLVGEIAGTAATMFSPFGKGSLAKALTATPAGAVSKFGIGGKTALARIAHTSGEGLAYGVGQALSNVALAEPGITAEQVVSELGQGALLGAAMGAAGGVFAEGVGAASKLRGRPKPAVLDLTSGPGRDAIETLSKSQRGVDNVLDLAAKEHGTFIKRAGDELANARAAGLAQPVTEVHAAMDALRAGAPKHAAAFEQADKFAARALKTGTEKDALTFLVYVDKTARKAGATDLADSAAAHIARNMDVAAAADEKLAGLAVKFPKAKYDKIFDLLPGQTHGPESFGRLLRLAEKEPQELLKRATMLDEFHAAARQAVSGSDAAKRQLADHMSEYQRAIDSIVSPEAAALLKDPKVLGQILGVEVGIEMLPEDTPGKRLLQLAAAYKMIGGVAGLKGMNRSLGRRIASAIGKRTSAGLASGLARSSSTVSGLSPALSNAVVGGAASAGYEGFGLGARAVGWLTGRGTKSAMASDAHVKSALDGALGRVSSGKPTKMRAMPAMNVILDRLLGDDPEHASKSPQAKYGVIQDRLARYVVAPDAALANVYEALKPVQEVSEQLADLMETVLGVQLPYLASKMPLDPGTMMMFGKSQWQATDRQLYEFSAHAMGVLMPLETIDMIADGLVPPQAAEALAATNPEIFAKFQASIVEHADEIRKNSTYSQRIALGLAFQLPLDPTTDPRYVAFVQSMHAQKTMEQAAGSSGEGSTPEESYSDAQKLLA